MKAAFAWRMTGLVTMAILGSAGWVGAGEPEQVEAGETSPRRSKIDELLAGRKVRQLYAADFNEPVAVTAEEDLGEKDGEELKRVKEPETEWVIEGAGEVEVKDGRLHLRNKGGHTVLWNTRVFPGDFLAEWDFSPSIDNGLAIVFFSMTAKKNGGSIFQKGLRARRGNFDDYHHGDLHGYHISYFSYKPDADEPREASHVRKHWGHHLVAKGTNPVPAKGRGPVRLRLLKLGPRIVIEADGEVMIDWTDDGRKGGPAHGGGQFGLRQMERTREAGYGYLTISEIVK